MVVKEKIGTVVSDKMEKTVVVLVENLYSHPLSRSRSYGRPSNRSDAQWPRRPARTRAG